MTIKPIAQIQHEGVSALMKELGPVDTARFIRSYYQGKWGLYIRTPEVI